MWFTYKENGKKDFQYQDNVKHVANINKTSIRIFTYIVISKKLV
jgi:hypothetical protein